MRRSVENFAEAMERKLQQKEAKHPNGWRNDDTTIEFLECRLRDEGRELAHAIAALRDRPATHESREKFLEESADFLNFLMMIADIMGCLGDEQ